MHICSQKYLSFFWQVLPEILSLIYCFIHHCSSLKYGVIRLFLPGMVVLANEASWRSIQVQVNFRLAYQKYQDILRNLNNTNISSETRNLISLEYCIAAEFSINEIKRMSNVHIGSEVENICPDNLIRYLLN